MLVAKRHKSERITGETSSQKAKHKFVLPQPTKINPIWHTLATGMTSSNRSPRLQTKLTVGAPNDKYEQEADRVAEKVMRMPEPREDEEFDIQRKIEPPTVQRLCAGCEEELQRQPMEEEEPEALQMKGKFDGGQSVPQLSDTTTSQIQSLRGGGKPLSPETRSFFEPRFGREFSHVRVHTGSDAERSTKRINARAYTLGKDIVFGSGQYACGSSAGKKLLAHELTHVVQQQRWSKDPAAQTKLAYGQSADATRHVADSVDKRNVAKLARRAEQQVDQSEKEVFREQNTINIKQTTSSQHLAGKWIIRNPSSVQVSGGATNEDLLKDAFQDICNATQVVTRRGDKVLQLSGATPATNRAEGCGCLQTIETDVNNFLGGRASFLRAIPRIGVDVNGWSFTSTSPSSPEVGVRHPEDPFGWGYWSGADQRKQKEFFRTVAHEVCGHMAAEVLRVPSGRSSGRGHNEAIIRENLIAGEHGVSAADQRGLDKSEGGVTAGVHRGESFLRSQVFFDHDSDLPNDPSLVSRVVNGVTGTIQFFANQLGIDRICVQLEGFGLSNESNAIINQRILNMRSELILAFGAQSIADPFPDPDSPGNQISRFARDISTQLTGQSAPNASDPGRRVDIFIFHRSHSAR